MGEDLELDEVGAGVRANPGRSVVLVCSLPAAPSPGQLGFCCTAAQRKAGPRERMVRALVQSVKSTVEVGQREQARSSSIPNPTAPRWGLRLVHASSEPLWLNLCIG